jgi:hypothetical protein
MKLKNLCEKVLLIMNSNDQHPQHDLIGGPFAVIESDPGIIEFLSVKSEKKA